MAIDREFIRGRLERVYVTNNVRETGCVIGNFHGNDVFVPYDSRYVNKHIVARFDVRGSRDLNAPPRVNFITSKIPYEFRGLPPEDYVLCGLWQSHMIKAGIAPSFEEFERYFEPGKKGHFVHIRGGSGNSPEIIKVDSNGKMSECHIPLRCVVKKGLPLPNHFVRVVVIEGENHLEKTLGEIKDQGVTTILMESLDKQLV